MKNILKYSLFESNDEKLDSDNIFNTIEDEFLELVDSEDCYVDRDDSETSIDNSITVTLIISDLIECKSLDEYKKMIDSNKNLIDVFYRKYLSLKNKYKDFNFIFKDYGTELSLIIEPNSTIKDFYTITKNGNLNLIRIDKNKLIDILTDGMDFNLTKIDYSIHIGKAYSTSREGEYYKVFIKIKNKYDSFTYDKIETIKNRIENLEIEEIPLMNKADRVGYHRTGQSTGYYNNNNDIEFSFNLNKDLNDYRVLA